MEFRGGEHALPETINKYVFCAVSVLTVSLNFVGSLTSIVLQLACYFYSIATFTPPQPHISLTYRRVAYDEIREVPVP